jgi:hypothetical protein
LSRLEAQKVLAYCLLLTSWSLDWESFLVLLCNLGGFRVTMWGPKGL